MCLFGKDSKRKKALKKRKQIVQSVTQKSEHCNLIILSKGKFHQKKALLLDSVSWPLTVLSGKSKQLKKSKQQLDCVMLWKKQNLYKMQIKRNSSQKMQNVIKYLIMEN